MQIKLLSLSLGNFQKYLNLRLLLHKNCSHHPPMCLLFCCVNMTACAHEINQIRKVLQIKIILSRRGFFFNLDHYPDLFYHGSPRYWYCTSKRTHKEQKWRARNQGLTHSVLLLNMLLWIMSYKSVHNSGNPTYESLTVVFLCSINSKACNKKNTLFLPSLMVPTTWSFNIMSLKGCKKEKEPNTNNMHLQCYIKKW